ncbi:hypothetical protein [Maritimibacter sp. 55A14]|uniref:hypothetical protein n=1 Tax=Maritimibacter sp. 55A14 TaxID=2174844 RepID=UPI0026A2BD62
MPELNSDAAACRTKCWVAAVVLGLIAVWLFAAGLDMPGLLAFVLGVAGAIAAGWLLIRFVCGGADVQSEGRVARGVKGNVAKEDEPGRIETSTADVAETPHERAMAESAAAGVVPVPSPFDRDEPPAPQPGEAASGTGAPERLEAPRGSQADDLKRIKGVGPKLEAQLNSLGFWHFDQIAGWSADDAAWVDANLRGFKGRVERDNWVEQARILAQGGETEFSKKVDKGDVY